MLHESRITIHFTINLYLAQAFIWVLFIANPITNPLFPLLHLSFDLRTIQTTSLNHGISGL